MKQRTYLLVLMILFSFFASAQINEAGDNSVYAYLYRMAQKGLVNIQDYILPLDRFEIKQCLGTIKGKESSLSAVEKKELYFFLKDYSYDGEEGTEQKPLFLKKDSSGRFRTFSVIGKQAQLFLDPIIGGEYTRYRNAYNTMNYGGVRIWGNLGKHFGYNVAYRDVTERGDSIDITKSFSPTKGIINTSANAGQLNYSDLSFNIGYRWKNGILSIGKDALNWGYGVSGKIVLSSKAPSFPYIRIQYQPFKWLKFNYFNAWLNSNIVDSSRSYYTGTGVNGSYREVFRSKYLAQHSISIIPVKGLDIAIGESIVYSDKMDLGYLIPINIYKLYDQYASNYNLNGGSNSQIFAQISSRDQLKKTHLYFLLFIDEIRATKIFSKTESRNQLAYTLGINKTDLFLHYLTVGAEYTHVNPFVYSNIIPAQAYTNATYTMGDWMGSNADRLYVFADYTPMARLKLRAWAQKVRKGGEGTIQQQYFQQPQPEFLFDRVLDQKSFGLNISYEAINRLVFGINYSNLQTSYYQVPYTSSNNSMNFYMRYGL